MQACSPLWPVTLWVLVGTSPAWAQALDADTLKFRADYTLKTDSNLQRLSSSANTLALTGRTSAAERIGITTIGVKFNKAYSLQRLELDLSLVDYNYQNFSQFSFTASNYAAAWRWSLTPRFYGSLTTDREETLNSFSDFQGLTPITQRNQRTTTATGFDATYDIDGTWSLLGGVTRTQQTNQLTLGTGDDYSANSASVGVRRASGSNSALTYNLKSSTGKNLNTNASSNEFNQIDNELRLFWVVTGNTTASLSATYINRSHPNLPARDYSGLNTGVNVNWNITGKTTLAANWVHQLASFQTTYSDYTQTDRLSLGPTWNVGNKTYVGLRYDLARIDYRGSSPTALRQDTTRDTTLTLNWQPTLSLAVIASLKKSTRDATVTNLPALDYSNNISSLSAEYSF